jgi:hypothetical protein
MLMSVSLEHSHRLSLTYYDVVMVSVLALPVKITRIPAGADFGSNRCNIRLFGLNKCILLMRR